METNELNNTRSFWHDAAGNLTRKKDRNERVTQYTFDDLDRMTSELWLASGDPVPTIAISTSTQGGPVNEVQRVGFSDMMGLTGGTFTLSFGGNTTSAIAYNASAATVQTALEGLASIGSGNISVTKTTDTSLSKVWTLTFQGSLAAANQSQLTINCSSVTTMVMMPPSAIQATDVTGSSGSNGLGKGVILLFLIDGSFPWGAKLPACRGLRELVLHVPRSARAVLGLGLVAGRAVLWAELEDGKDLRFEI